MATFEVIRFLELLFSVSFKRSFLSSPSFLAFQTMIVEFLVLNLMSGENFVQNERLLLKLFGFLELIFSVRKFFSKII